MRILAFDLGAKFGWACLDGPVDPGDPPPLMYPRRRGSWEDSVDGRTDVDFGEMTLTGNRAYRFSSWMHQVHDFLSAKTRVDIVVYETPHMRGRDATRCLFGYAGILEAQAEMAEVPILDVPPRTVKKFITGSANAPKEEVMAVVQRRWAPSVRGLDESDALALAVYTQQNVVVDL